MMMSNLGVLPIETNYGDLILEAFWGRPSLLALRGSR
jgi:hypothetical protein